jgi:hypothetical protein
MRADIEFYLDGPVEERIRQLSTLESPLKMRNKLEDFYILDPKNKILDSSFIYTAPDSEQILTNPLHMEAQKTLGFEVKSNLHYRGCIFSPEKIGALREIANHLEQANIPHYMTVIEEYGKEIFVRGHNPITGIKIQNPIFNRTLQRLLTEL